MSLLCWAMTDPTYIRQLPPYTENKVSPKCKDRLVLNMNTQNPLHFRTLVQNTRTSTIYVVYWYSKRQYADTGERQVSFRTDVTCHISRLTPARIGPRRTHCNDACRTLYRQPHRHRLRQPHTSLRILVYASSSESNITVNNTTIPVLPVQPKMSGDGDFTPWRTGSRQKANALTDVPWRQNPVTRSKNPPFF